MLAIVLGLLLIGPGALQLWDAFRRNTFYGAGGIKYQESPTKNAAHFWARVILTGSSIAVGGWLVMTGIDAVG